MPNLDVQILYMVNIMLGERSVCYIDVTPVTLLNEGYKSHFQDPSRIHKETALSLRSSCDEGCGKQ